MSEEEQEVERYEKQTHKSRLQAWLKKTFLVLFSLYGIGLLSLPVLWWGLGERHWPLILLRYLPGGLSLIPIPVFLLLLRDRRATLAGFCLSLFCLFAFMDLQLPFRRKGAGDLTFVSYNIQAGLGGAAQLGTYFKDGDFDIIGLQEARAPLKDPKADPIPTVATFLPDYQIARGGIRGELVVLSKYPILSFKESDLAGLSKALDVRVKSPGGQVRVLNVHLMTGDPLKELPKGSGLSARLRMTAKTRHRQFAALNELLEEQVPTVLMGDFNTPPRSVGTKMLSKWMVDSFSEVGAGLGNTYRAKWPIWRIDYIWLSPQFEAASARVEPQKLSDHRPLVVEVSRAKEDRLGKES